MEWYYTEGGSQKGPVSETEIVTLFQNGALGASALVWREGMQDWISVEKSELSIYLHRPSAGGHGQSVPPPGASLEENPYAAPVSDPLPRAGAVDPTHSIYPYRSPKVLAGIVTAALALLSIVLIGLSAFIVMNPELMSDGVFETDEEAADLLLIGLLGIAYLLVFSVCVVFWCIWTNRCAKNIRALGANPSFLEFTPGWAVGWYFIPIAFWWKPYQAHREIWLASDSPGQPAVGSVPSLVGIWWAAWVVMNIFSNVSSRIDDADIQVPITIVDLALTLIAAGCAVAVCLKLTKLQDQRAREAGVLPS
ncbi:MAG: DUF4328 domain-containing protein [Verrucomicrobiales bacterium]